MRNNFIFRTLGAGLLALALGCGGDDAPPDAAPTPDAAPPPDASPLADANPCGNGVINEGEQCDDGNASDGDGCELTCERTIRALALGSVHTCVVYSDGRVRCWGEGDDGRLGTGNTNDIGDDEPARAVFVDVGDTARDIGAGGAHTCVRLISGDARCWGATPANGQAQIVGDNELPSSVPDVGVGFQVARIRGGDGHTCAVSGLGTVRCWGGGAATGVLGYGNTEDIGDDEPPAAAGDVSFGANANDIALGLGHTCVRDTANNVKCWGTPTAGVLGQPGVVDVIGDDETPATIGVVNLGGTVVTQIVAGAFHTCALGNGAVRCWGSGAEGQLGYGNTEDVGDDEAPVEAGTVDVGGTPIQIAAGDFHTCALLDTGEVRCWGANGSGQLGQGNTEPVGDDETPASVPPVALDIGAVEIAAGGDHTCAVVANGRLRCWGANGSGQLGYGNTENIGDDESPQADVPVF